MTRPKLLSNYISKTPISSLAAFSVKYIAPVMAALPWSRFAVSKTRTAIGALVIENETATWDPVSTICTKERSVSNGVKPESVSVNLS